jgi:hypothetical protein
MPDKTTVKQRGNSGNLRPFKKGQSGNPNGRPKKINTIPDILRKIGEEEGAANGNTKLEVVMRKIFQYALEGKSWAVQFIADRTEGKAIERLQTTEIDRDELIIE